MAQCLLCFSVLSASFIGPVHSLWKELPRDGLISLRTLRITGGDSGAGWTLRCTPHITTACLLRGEDWWLTLQEQSSLCSVQTMAFQPASPSNQKPKLVTSELHNPAYRLETCESQQASQVTQRCAVSYCPVCLARSLPKEPWLAWNFLCRPG